MKHTKRALVLSAVVLILSVAMLAGATFAWFTDSVTNSGNKIEAGNLSVALLQKTSTLSAAQQEEITAASDKPLTTEDGFTVISALTSPVFDYSLWEPGYSTGAVFKVKNSGTLAFKFGFAFASLDATQNLGNVLHVSVNGEDKGTLAEFATGTPFFSGILGSGMTSAELDIVIRMDTNADNDYQGATAKFDLVLKAVQTSLEEDGFGNPDYDAGASEGWVDAPKADSVVVPVTPGEDTTIVNPDYLAKAEVPVAALADGATSLTFSIIETESVPEGVTVSTGQEAMPFDIKVDGLKAVNTAPVAVSLFVGKALTDVTVYHNSDAIESTYDSATGIVRFTTTSFSPFTVVYGMAWDGVSRDSQGLTANTDDATKTVTIDTPAQFAAFATAVNSGTSYKGYTVTLTNDINLAYHEWTPIGTQAAAFEGVFDGNNFTVSNLFIDDVTLEHAGLFGILKTPGNIKKLTLSNVTITAKASAGALIGTSYTGSIEACKVEGKINITANYKVGGLSGGGYAKLTDCHIDATSGSAITGVYAEKDLEGDNIGGLIGFVGEGNTTLSGCSVSGITVAGTRKVGGIAGSVFTNNHIDYCKVDNITVSSNATDSYITENASSIGIGGIVGVFTANGKGDGSLTNCTVNNITMSGGNGVWRGYLVGGMRGDLPDFPDAPWRQENNSITGINSGTNSPEDAQFENSK